MKKLLLFAAVLMFSLSAFSQVPQLAKVELWWPFCNDSLDHSGHGYDPIFVNAFLTADRYGTPNSAAVFNGVNGQVTYSAPLFVTATLDYTYSCWIFPNANQNSIILHNGNPSTDGMGLVMNNGAGGPGNMVAIAFGGIGQFINTPVTLGQWHQIAFTRSGNAYRLYVDGVNAGFWVQPIFNLPTNLFTVGIDNTTGLKPFNGLIDDIIYYKSGILSAGELNQLGNFNPVSVPFTLGNDTAMCKDTITLQPNPLPPSFYYPTWSTPPTIVGYADTYLHVLPLPTGLPDTVQIQLCVSETLGCKFCDTIKVSHYLYRLNLGTDTAFCFGDTLKLHATGGDTATYTWMSGTPTLGLDSFKVTTTGTYYVYADSNTCRAWDTIKVYTALHPKIHLGPDTSSCSGLPVVVRDTTTHGSPSYLWSTGSLVDSTTVLTSSMVWLKVTDTGCASYDTINVFIAFDTFTLHTPNTAICRGDDVSAVVTGAAGLTYQWTPTTGIPFPTDTSAIPTITPDTSAWYIVTASVGSCHVSDSFYIDVQPNPLVYLGGNRHVCEKDSIRISPVVLPTWYHNYSYDWTPGTNLDDSTAATARFTAGDTTKLFLVVKTPAGCTSKDSMEIFTHLIDFVSLDTAISPCPGDTIRLRPRSGTKYDEGPITYAWYYAPDFVNATDSTPLLHVGTSKDYIGVATSKWGCRDTMHVGVMVQPGATFYLPDSTVIFPGESYHILPETNASIFHWSPGVGLNDTTSSNPIATPPVNTKYIVTAITSQGCVITDSIKIRIDAGISFAVPNAFSPTGKNPRFYVIPLGEIALRSFRIFDKWGNLVYESTNIAEGWDGNYKGVPQPMGVYVYQVEAVNEKGKVIRKAGNVTLLR